MLITYCWANDTVHMGSSCTQNIPLEEAFLVNFIEKAHRTSWKTKYFRSTKNEPYLSPTVVIATSTYYSPTDWYAKEVLNKSMICNLLYGNVMCWRISHSYLIHSCSQGDISARSVCKVKTYFHVMQYSW